MMRKISLLSIIFISCTFMVQATKIRLFNNLNDKHCLNLDLFIVKDDSNYCEFVLFKESYAEALTPFKRLDVYYKGRMYQIFYSLKTGILQVRSFCINDNKWRLSMTYCKNIGANRKLIEITLNEDKAGNILFATEKKIYSEINSEVL